jgi:hypothetical protein
MFIGVLHFISSTLEWLYGAALSPEAISSLAQIGLLLVAVVSAYYAYRQVNAFKLSQLVSYLQDESFRNSRRVVIQDIWGKRQTEWWKDRELEIAASTCAGHFDVVGNLLRYTAPKSLQKFVIRSWSESIVRIHELLQQFMAERRKSGGNNYADFDWLYKRAKKHIKNVGAPWPRFTGVSDILCKSGLCGG